MSDKSAQLPSASTQSILMAKVSGNVRLLETLGADETQWAIDRCIKRIERSTEAFGGQVIEQSGGELVSAFQSADAALRAAVEMQQKIGDLPPVSGITLQIGVGFSQGYANPVNGENAGAATKIAAALTGLAIPGEILTDESTQSALSAQLRQLTCDHGAFAANSHFANSRIFQVLSAPPDESSPTRAAQGLVQAATAKLLISYNEQVFVLDDVHPTLRLGRGADNDVVIQSHRVSRHHARIEKRERSFVLIDTSTNGSYLNPEGLSETSLRHSECLIHGKGIISLASHAWAKDADVMVFEMLGE